jgi:hypothetical protein
MKPRTFEFKIFHYIPSNFHRKTSLTREENNTCSMTVVINDIMAAQILEKIGATLNFKSIHFQMHKKCRKIATIP